MTMKEKLLVSVSGGETSVFMAQWLWLRKRDIYDMEFVFANTGQENEETLIFMNQSQQHFGFPVIWIEAKVNKGRKGSTHTVVDFKTASRNGDPFEAVIQKYGIPNQAYPHCTRELKLNPIHSYVKSELRWKGYYTAIGIRPDEIDRVKANHAKLKLLYPLITDMPMTKQKINFWWSQQLFRLNLKGYQGNCKTCWKKSDPKLYQLAKEDPLQFDFFRMMENRYGSKKVEGRNGDIGDGIKFFRQNRSVDEILEEAISFNKKVIDDTQNIQFQTDLFTSESCDIYSSCGD